MSQKPYTYEEIQARVFDIISDRDGIPREEIKMEKELGKDLGVDSLDAVELIMELEKEWNVAISDEDGYKIRTVRDCVDLIAGKVIPKN